MDKIIKYSQIIKNFLTQQTQVITQLSTTETETIFDDSNYRYLLLHLGWEGQKRIYSVLLHLEIRANKIWIQENNTDISVTEILLTQGVVREDIILGLKPAFVRQYTGFGVA